ncbi:MAG: hypothetical protein L6R38_003603 [Xanthoria sp. 2 TBL-2021]|nr:MAG: hypothetical protein L6R38_003603 [Xanthoria sp. 2 TBL-2021]
MDFHSRNGRPPSIDSENERPTFSRIPPPSVALGHRSSRRKGPGQHGQSVHPNPPLTPNAAPPSAMPQAIPNPLLPSAPASPPTPAPSPTPHQRSATWHEGDDEVEDPVLRNARFVFGSLDMASKEVWLTALVDMCDNQTLGFLHRLVGPRLKKDPFKVLPDELCLRVLEYVDDPKTFVRASSVSKRWRELVSDDQAWKTLCEKHEYRRISTESIGSSFTNNTPTSATQAQWGTFPRSVSPVRVKDSMTSIDENSDNMSHLSGTLPPRKAKRPRPKSTHRSHFKHRYMVESAWRKGGRMKAKHITPDQGVVTSLHLTKKYIIVALDNAKIHVFDTQGEHLRTLQGHMMGVWAMVPWEDTLVSGGCDRDVRVWNMATGASVHTLRGHTSTVRCLKMANSRIAISGSRDTTLRVWDLVSGTCANVLIGHQASVRCLAIHDDMVVSGSYDTTAKIWSITSSQCLRTLQGHFSQIYAIAFDGQKVATGSLDTSVRIWNPYDGNCLAILQGHTSLVGQLQMRNSTLVTGGSDGSVRVWSLNTYTPIHRLAAHDNSVTSLQFDDLRIVSGGSDGRVKIWDLGTGTLIRELSQPAEIVWRVAFESERCVVMASRTTRTIMEVWDFTPPAEDDERSGRRVTASTAGRIMPPNEVLTGETNVAADQTIPALDDDNMDGIAPKENEDMMDAETEDEDDDMTQDEQIT